MDKLKDLQIEDLPPSQRELAEVIGLETYLKLVMYVNGDSIYLPKLDSLEEMRKRSARDEEIIAKFDGYNFKELANEYNLTVKWVYRIIPKHIRDQKRKAPGDGQIGMDELLENVHG